MIRFLFTREDVVDAVCGERVRHPSPGAARHEVHRLRALGRDVYAHRCPFCSSWHVAPTPPIELVEALARVIRGLDPIPPTQREEP